MQYLRVSWASNKRRSNALSFHSTLDKHGTLSSPHKCKEDSILAKIEEKHDKYQRGFVQKNEELYNKMLQKFLIKERGVEHAVKCP